jgi:biotin operon repressor
LWQPILTVVVYFLAVVSLTILLEIVPTLAMWSPVGFTVMGLTGGWLAALTSDQDEREKSRADLRKKAQEAQELARKAKQEKKQGKQLAQASPGLAGKTDKQDQQLAQVAPASPDKLHPQVARKADKLQAQDSKQPVQDEALLAYWRDNPQASDQQVADKFGKSRQAIQQRRDKLIDKGEIKMTPQGVEIIGIAVGVAEVTA